MAPEIDVYYEGSRIFSWVSDLSGLPLDQVRRMHIHSKCEVSVFSNSVSVKWLHKYAQFLCLLGDFIGLCVEE